MPSPRPAAEQRAVGEGLQRACRPGSCHPPRDRGTVDAAATWWSRSSRRRPGRRRAGDTPKAATHIGRPTTKNCATHTSADHHAPCRGRAASPAARARRRRSKADSEQAPEPDRSARLCASSPAATHRQAGFTNSDGCTLDRPGSEIQRRAPLIIDADDEGGVPAAARRRGTPPGRAAGCAAARRSEIASISIDGMRQEEDTGAGEDEASRRRCARPPAARPPGSASTPTPMIGQDGAQRPAVDGPPPLADDAAVVARNLDHAALPETCRRPAARAPWRGTHHRDARSSSTGPTRRRPATAAPRRAPHSVGASPRVRGVERRLRGRRSGCRQPCRRAAGEQLGRLADQEGMADRGRTTARAAPRRPPSPGRRGSSRSSR